MESAGVLCCWSSKKNFAAAFVHSAVLAVQTVEVAELFEIAVIVADALTSCCSFVRAKQMALKRQGVVL